MARYAAAPVPSALYVWDMRLQKAFLEDIAHVEVLLRNFIAVRLAADCEREEGDRAWCDHPERYGMNEGTRASIKKAKSRLAHEGKEAACDRVVAALTFDTWRYLLVRRHEPTVWRVLRDPRNGGMPNHPGTSRADFEERVSLVYSLRNRCSHQEHLALDDADEESAAFDAYAAALDWIARKIDPEAADWIQANSRVAEVRAQRPARPEAEAHESEGPTAPVESRVPDAAPKTGEAASQGLAPTTECSADPVTGCAAEGTSNQLTVSEVEAAAQEVPDPAAEEAPTASAKKNVREAVSGVGPSASCAPV